MLTLLILVPSSKLGCALLDSSMASNNITSTSTSRSKKQHGEAAIDDCQILKNKIDSLKEKIHDERLKSIKDKLWINRENLRFQLSEVMAAVSRNTSLQTEEVNAKMLSSRIDNPVSKFSGFRQGLGRREQIQNQDVSFEKSFMLPSSEKIPPYTFWLHLARNERMTKDQSFAARRNIYYQHGGETMICSDTEEECKENKEAKHFSQGEDQILWMVFEEHDFTEEALSVVHSCIGGTHSEIQERYKYLKEKDMHAKNSRESESITGICLDKSLSASLSTFDHFFCRRCMIYNCPLHGCSQPLIYPSEKQSVWNEPEGESKPCSDNCYLKIKDVNTSSEKPTLESSPDKEIKKTENVEMDYHLDLNSDVKDSDLPVSSLCDSTSPCESQNSHKKLKRILESKETANGDYNKESAEITDKIELLRLSNSMEWQVDEKHSISDWKPLEKDLYLKGIEMFGRNSCLIFRNLLSGFKTCTEIASYMRVEEAARRSIDENGKFDAKCTDHEMRSSLRSSKKKGKSKQFKYLPKTPRLKPNRINAGGNILLTHYTPCECQGKCGKQCPCRLNGYCCEKYCGCAKLCGNRFRGCHCVITQCRKRNCPCFAANRECDPDVCRNCWVSCGDGSLGEPPHHGENECENMNLSLGKKQRILLAKSDVAGWGAFLKNPANKDDFLGEYTGELISHTEAEKRGKLYERADFSFLFDLDDEYVIDAYRKGDKLKFANHSSKPNCYAKGMFVRGDHRVGIFAGERIEAGEELFYDYKYAANHRAPAWFVKANNAAKKKELANSHGKAKKR
ncbi:histone-lysine N-methyltransferase EZA1-like isoform X3 [Vicia villosa]|uniref:histone-lysine N-methyltransferase EZA1-like isoform X3 n=2 Tax=Vicia villosa TaxID=3911 RepID=UPI00273BC615|nr:histone-lysine N-methyltransferase EZA1-like isoform X3 [Vicia villosa]XP_058763640.1 histone-lysine N-methyltransferase EZA1-like isoform X3 [Vicia villosa]XP_058763641.1 histone-lysine N-methyltransferase EZA1-like isoform X3 [Vicia villosa]XP_058763642.1 histone-lysine N-methyltransferase EZA1-like isoform X3 [Vicia villosa]XP_058763643.1 histone-lysine N-methyltransferase EZA1-like isoform X3 [Vicia villosa]XP_058763644.1 histone-lysine N-methyltransferase EZA1-like isoform X3 [Vicia vi